MKKLNKHKMIAIACIIFIFVGIATFLMIKTSIAKSREKREQEKTEAELKLEEGIETDIEFAKDKEQTQSDLRFPDTREFTPEELEDEFEPEGTEIYEVDEQESPYTVYVENIAEMADQYNDIYNCMNLKYYLMVYLRCNVGNYDERYVATLVKGSCVNSESTTVLTVDATIDKYPDVIFHIEYDKVNKAFGIKSDLGDFSLDALRQESKTDMLEFDPEIAGMVSNDNIAPVTTTE